MSVEGRPEPLPDPFLVLATQNPIESEGVYPLPEAQRDRFLMKVLVDYPTPIEELEIVRRMGVDPPVASTVIDPDTLARLQRVVGEHQPVAEHVAGHVEDVLRQHVVPAAHQGEGAAGRDQPE